MFGSHATESAEEPPCASNSSVRAAALGSAYPESDAGDTR